MSYERKKRMKNMLTLLHQKKEEMTVKEIANILNVSDMTIRRDLQDLENDRLVKRTHGGATIPDPSRTIHDVYVVEEQTGRNVNEKSKIGLKAASFVKPNETIFLDSGTTTPFIARHLDRELPLTVLCYTFQNATEFYYRKHTNLILSGGYFHRDSNVFHSREGCALIKNNRADKAFISAAGIDETLGLTTYFYFEADIKRAIIGSAKQIILVADSSKFGKISTTYFASLNEVQTIITDDDLSDNYREIVQNLGIELVIAD
jgi:DeoR family deoxyribose operon repressor